MSVSTQCINQVPWYLIDSLTDTPGMSPLSLNVTAVRSCAEIEQENKARLGAGDVSITVLWLVHWSPCSVTRRVC